MRYKRSGTHKSQFDGSPKAKENCTPTSGANGAREATGGNYNHTGGYVRSLVKQSEETNPATPGWSLDDLDLAMRRAKVPFEKGKGGWAGVREWRAKGCGIVLQGDSDQFSNSTCSGKFDGDHAVYVHPDTRVVDGATEWLLGDPICGTYRWEKESELRDYAAKFSSGILYGVFTTPLQPLVEEPDVTPIVKYLPGYTASIKPQSNVRSEPRIASTKLRTTTAIEPVVLIGTVKGDPDPGNANSTEWYMWWKNGRYEYTATDNIAGVKAPVADDGYTAATQAAAVAKQKAADQAAIDAANAATATAAKTERERLAVALGKSEAEKVLNA